MLQFRPRFKAVAQGNFMQLAQATFLGVQDQICRDQFGRLGKTGGKVNWGNGYIFVVKKCNIIAAFLSFAVLL